MSVSEQVCRRCGHDFCSECVVYPFGTSKGAMCIACALEAGGVSRQKTGRPRLSRKEVRERLAQAPTPAAAVEVTLGEPSREVVDDADRAWLNGDVDAESLGGWSQRF